jgi:hypothetical protein
LESAEPQLERGLTIKERLDYQYILTFQILSLVKARSGETFDIEQIREIIRGILDSIPKVWRDDEFRDELKKAIIKETVDMRPSFCGVKPSLEVCEKLGIKPFVDHKVYDYNKLFHAIINLLQRKHMLSKIQRVEELVEIQEIEQTANDETIKRHFSSK